MAGLTEETALHGVRDDLAPRRPAIAIVADDLTGAGDVAGILGRAGIATSLLVGVPSPNRPIPAADAVVVGLRIRTAAVADAVARASAAARWLLEGRPSVLAWKICSTFDSTPAGNIGPVTDALLELTGLPAALVCPAFPENGRTVVGGRLLVDGAPLDRSYMRDHPLTPMRDADLVRLLAPQVAEPARVGRLGARPSTAALDAAAGRGLRYVIADAADDDEAFALGEAVVGRALPVIASGLVGGIVARLRREGALGAPVVAAPPHPVEGPALLLAGSCSVATRRQIDVFGAEAPVIRLDPTAHDPAGAALSRARAAFRRGEPAVLVASSDDPAGVDRVRAALGPQAGGAIEGWLADVAASLAGDGVRRFVIAGGETSGSVLEALGVRELRIGPELAPGVPILERVDGEPMLVVAKSGNFGGPDLFARAVAATGRPASIGRSDNP